MITRLWITSSGKGRGQALITNKYIIMTQETKHTGYRSKEYGIPTKRYCQCLELRDNKELIAKYREVHDEEHVWKEVIEGIRQVGILEMEIYIAGTHLVMIVDTAIDFDWNTAMAKLATLPRQAEWEAFVSEFQGCAKDATSDEKWQLMDRMFRLY